MRLSAERCVYIAGAVLCLSACSASDPDPGRLVAPGVAVYPPGEEGGDGALLEGVLGDAGDCLFVTDAEGQSVIPLFPDGGVSWDGETLSIETSGGTVGRQEARVGERLSVGGGYRSERPSDAVIPPGCPADFAVFQIGNVR